MTHMDVFNTTVNLKTDMDSHSVMVTNFRFYDPCDNLMIQFYDPTYPEMTLRMVVKPDGLLRRTMILGKWQAIPQNDDP